MEGIKLHTYVTMGKRLTLEHLSIFEYKLEIIDLSKHYLIRLVNNEYYLFKFETASVIF